MADVVQINPTQGPIAAGGMMELQGQEVQVVLTSQESQGTLDTYITLEKPMVLSLSRM